MNRRTLLKSTLAAFALTTGLARARFELPEPDIEIIDGDTILIHFDWIPAQNGFGSVAAFAENGIYTKVVRS